MDLKEMELEVVESRDVWQIFVMINLWVPYKVGRVIK
jgi:hypothetical protein